MSLGRRLPVSLRQSSQLTVCGRGPSVSGTQSDRPCALAWDPWRRGFGVGSSGDATDGIPLAHPPPERANLAHHRAGCAWEDGRGAYRIVAPTPTLGPDATMRMFDGPSSTSATAPAHTARTA